MVELIGLCRTSWARAFPLYLVYGDRVGLGIQCAHKFHFLSRPSFGQNLGIELVNFGFWLQHVSSAALIHAKSARIRRRF